MATRNDVIKRAYACLDEIYPDSTNVADASAFRIEEFVDEAARYVVRIAPLRALGEGVDFSQSTITSHPTIDKAVVIDLSRKPMERLIALRFSDWTTTITELYTQYSPRYTQQCDEVLRGTPKRPIAFLCNGGTSIECYGTDGTISTFRGVQIIGVNGDTYPEPLASAIAWKTAELSLSMMNDAQGVQFAQAQVQQLIQAL